VIDAAEQTRSPIIVGFNGGFLSAADRLAREQLTWYAGLGRAAAQSASVPCGFLLNECPSDDWVRLAITSRFNLVMPADSAAAFERYVERVTALTSLAHAHGVAVEAEVGELPAGVAGHGTGGGSLTDPHVAGEFVAATGIDLLAVSVGIVHVKVAGSQGLDLRVWKRFMSASRSRWSCTAERASPPLRCARRLPGAWPRSITRLTSSRAICEPSAGRLTGCASTRTGASAWGGQTISWLPAAGGSATRSSSGSNFSAVAGGLIDRGSRPWTSR
jgi:Fructose-bisphosphate aldolase class-II